MPRSLSILEAMDDPRLLGNVFPATSRAAWRAFFAALYGLNMYFQKLLCKSS